MPSKGGIASGWLLWWRRRRARARPPARRSALMAVSRSGTITVGPCPSWIRLASSPSVTSLTRRGPFASTQCKLEGEQPGQCPRRRGRAGDAVADLLVRLVANAPGGRQGEDLGDAQPVEVGVQIEGDQVPRVILPRVALPRGAGFAPVEQGQSSAASRPARRRAARAGVALGGAPTNPAWGSPPHGPVAHHPHRGSGEPSRGPRKHRSSERISPAGAAQTLGDRVSSCDDGGWLPLFLGVPVLQSSTKTVVVDTP